MVTATLTRPTSIAPTMTCDRDVQLLDSIDIGQVRPPRARPIFLEPISKRKRRKKSVVRDKAAPLTPDAHDATSETALDESSAADDASRNRSTVDLRNPDQSDRQSEISGESVRSASTGGLSRAELAQVASAKQQAVDDKTITATVELLRGGCLPGDTVPVRVTVQHIERMKSMNGVIVTLFRRGKVDSSPPSSLFDDSVSDKDKRRIGMEEGYPRSRTGLGGLSLSSTSSTRIFRQDLDQTMAPLIIDPTSLQASVTVSVKLPERPFPTTIGVPGDMVAFRYYVEALVDLKGRAWSLISAQDSRLGNSGSGVFDGRGNSYSARRGPHIIDTQPLRNAKSVVSVAMEVIAGTKNSARDNPPARPRPSPSSRTLRTTASEDVEAPSAEFGVDGYQEASPPYINGQPTQNVYSDPQSSLRQYNQRPNPYGGPSAGPSQPYPYSATLGTHDEAPAYVPAPQMRDQEGLSEKERVRLAEVRLLPSQPQPPAGPSRDGGSASSGSVTPLPAPDGPSSPPAVAPDAGEEPSAPTPDDLAQAPALTEGEEDKQERERRRLLDEASAPPDFPEDMDRRRGGGMPSQDEASAAEPSAPVLHEDDDDENFGYGAGAGPSNGGNNRYDEELPAYQR